MARTAFENVSQMNILVGNSPTGKMACAKHQKNIIDEEVKELIAALENKDLTLTRDGVADVKVTVFGLMARLGISHFEKICRGMVQVEFCDHELKDTETTFEFLSRTWDHSSEDDAGNLNFLIANSTGNEIQTTWSVMVDVIDSREELGNALSFLTLNSAKIILLCEMIAAELKFNSDSDDLMVHRSNMTKFDTTPEDLQITIKKYYDLGVETIVRDVQIAGTQYYVVKSSYDQNGKDGKMYRGGKFLKSYLFEEPKFL